MAMNLGPKGAPKVRSGTIYSMRKMHCPPRKEQNLVEPETRKKEKKCYVAYHVYIPTNTEWRMR